MDKINIAEYVMLKYKTFVLLSVMIITQKIKKGKHIFQKFVRFFSKIILTNRTIVCIFISEQLFGTFVLCFERRK